MYVTFRQRAQSSRQLLSLKGPYTAVSWRHDITPTSEAPRSACSLSIDAASPSVHQFNGCEKQTLLLSELMYELVQALSGESRTLLVSRTRINFDHRAFSHLVQLDLVTYVWNNLPTDFREPETCHTDTAVSDSRWRRLRGGNGVGHINKVKLRTSSQVTATEIGDHFWRVYHSSIFQAIQPGHPSVGRCNEYWRWLRPPLVKKR